MTNTYIKLTRLDGSPIWINSAFIVTIEPRKLGGAVVVPIGDGLDYDVRESADQVLGMLVGTPAPEVVPVPAPKGLTKTPEDVSPDTDEPSDVPPPAAEPSPKKATRSRAKSATAAKGVRKARAKSASSEAPTPSAAETGDPKAAEPPPAEPAPLPAPISAPPASVQNNGLSDEQVARLRRMAPRSLKKLMNTLVSQFKVSAPEEMVAELSSRGVLSLDHDHVVWSAQI